MIDADELRAQARDAILTTEASTFLSLKAINELSHAAAIFAAQFAGESIKELQTNG